MALTMNVTIDGVPETITVKEDVSFSEILGAIHTGVDMCYDESHKCIPELIEFAIIYAQLSVLTDLQLGTTADEAYRIIRQIDFVPGRDAEFIDDGIRSSISYHTKMTAATICGSGSTMVAEQISDIANQFSGVLAVIGKIAENILKDTERNAQIDPNEIMEVLKKVKTSDKDLAHSILEYRSQTKKDGRSSSKSISRTIKK